MNYLPPEWEYTGLSYRFWFCSGFVINVRELMEADLILLSLALMMIVIIIQELIVFFKKLKYYLANTLVLFPADKCLCLIII